MSEQPDKTRDFAELRGSGARPGAGLLAGAAVARSRDVLVRGLAAVGIGPTAVTWMALIASLAAAACFVPGAGHAGPWVTDGSVAASWWPLAGAGLMLLSACLDGLDGALARAVGRQSEFGAVLDSTLDRVAELAVLVGCAVHFAVAGNVTYVALSLLAFGGGTSISYVKARVENYGVPCRVGYWQRGERLVVFAAAAAAGHIPAALWLLAIGPWFTVVRRVLVGRALLAHKAAGRDDGLGRLTQRRFPRGSLGYDLWTVVLAVYVFAAPVLLPLFTAGADPLRSWVRGGS
ncbi:MAG: CDP-alcohol phosphatidyltransferase family protein [Planctomycetota bacterium]|jgi:CDP-diacylglycerol--glycerol-3-phosphate 3-phosphatidyltransferase